jgi:AraC-like DNA-binding protein
MNLKSIQSRFMSKLADPLAIRTIFEHLPGVSFFVKDRQGQIITVSSSVLQRLGMSRETEFVGRKDADVYPPHMAACFLADDQWVFSTGQALINRLEVWLDEKGQPDWFVTTKVPLFGKEGAVIGLMGISRRDLNQALLKPANETTRAVAYLRAHIKRIVTTEELAESIGVSARTLNRRVNRDLGVSPHELILRVRVQAAAESLLKTEQSLSSIALTHGFCDQSHFTQNFRRRMGLTPRQFRAAHQSPDSNNLYVQAIPER